MRLLRRTISYGGTLDDEQYIDCFPFGRIVFLFRNFTTQQCQNSRLRSKLKRYGIRIRFLFRENSLPVWALSRPSTVKIQSLTLPWWRLFEAQAGADSLSA